MRHTLLPTQDRTALRKEYYARLIIVFCFTLSSAIVVGTVFLLPTYLRALSAEADATSLVANVAKDKSIANLTSIQQEVMNSLVLLNSLNVSDQAKIADLIKGVIDMKKDLKFNAFSATLVSTSTFTMSIQGVAPNRESLMGFKRDFENLSPGNKVPLPASDFAKSSNIPFSIQITEQLK